MIDATALRRFIYEEILANGTPPGSGRIAGQFGVDTAEARQSLAALKIGKTVLLHPKSGEIWMAGPFAAGPTTYEISRSGRRWWGNCAWDLLGVAAMVGFPVSVRGSCEDCGDPLSLKIDSRDQAMPDWLVHFLLPARRWYDDIGFT
jgi:hypothetical protein